MRNKKLEADFGITSTAVTDRLAMNESPAYFSYWGKANNKNNVSTMLNNRASNPYHLLPYHCLDVAAVGQKLLDTNKPLTQQLAIFLDITPRELQSLFTFFLALHDLGKFASAFQGLYQPENSSLITPDNQVYPYDGKNFKHDRLGWYFWKHKTINKTLHSLLDPDQRLTDNDHRTINKSLQILINCVLGHHGQPINTQNVTEIEDFTELRNTDAVNAFIKDLYTLLQPAFSIEQLKDKKWKQKIEQISWHLAGLAVLADWVGSNCDFFRYHATQSLSLSEYWSYAQKQANEAICSAGLNPSSLASTFVSVKHHFGFNPTPLQQWAETTPLTSTPQLFILEDVTGSGKTEAALTLTHRLMAQGVAHGFYFGLPTMATSNAMFTRIIKHHPNMWEGKQTPSIVLAHSAREMNDHFQDTLNAGPPDHDYEQTDQTATAQCNQWLADSRKKALLAPVGVGTIDQPLLAVLPRRHQSLRLLGLHNKVLIFDEVHAADEYMFELLEQLLTLHRHQGGSAILLTATLPLKQRQRLTKSWLKGTQASTSLKETAFPLATHITCDPNVPIKEQPLLTRSDVQRKVGITVINSEMDCIETLMTAVEKGQCAVWIRNTVNDAITGYQAIKERINTPDNCILFHSRFILDDRKTIETRVLDTFGTQVICVARGKAVSLSEVEACVPLSQLFVRRWRCFSGKVAVSKMAEPPW